MKILIACSLVLMGCSFPGAHSQDPILTLQSVWDSKDVRGAIEKINGLRKVDEDSDYEVYGVEDKIKIFSLSITVLKEDKKIISIVAPIDRGEEVPSRIIKEKLKTYDWKIFEHPLRGVDYLQLDITEYSEKLGVGFVYDKLDEEKKTRMLYWGVDPRNIKQLL